MITLYQIGHDLAVLILLSLITVGVSFFLDFCLGKPANDEGINPHAIFSGWIVFLSTRRLKKSAGWNFYNSVVNAYDHTPKFDFKNPCDHPTIWISKKTGKRKALVENAKEFFTWEHAAGFCIFCTNVWITILYSIIILIWFPPVLLWLPVYFLPLLLIIFSHLILRKIN